MGMGDPECQVILPRLKTDIMKIIIKALKIVLKILKLNGKKKSMTIVLCSKGYPSAIENIPINNMDKLKLSKNKLVFHAGTSIKNKKIVSIGGRVLNFTCLGKNFKIIRKNIIKLIQKLNWKQGFFRKDIGWKVVKS